MNSKRLYLSPPHMSGAELSFVTEAFQSGWVAPMGPMLDAFEKEMCAYTGSPHAAALSSGTAAIHLALLVLGVKSGDEVLCSTFTFAGSAFPITYVGATPVFVDSEERSWNMDQDTLDAALDDRIRKGRKPKAVIVVHLYGQPADMDGLAAVCEKHGVALIEDAAESLGTLYKGKHTGTIARLGVLSFNGNKIITSSGGGMLLGDSKDDIDKVRILSTQARDAGAHYEHSQVGYNYRMSNIVAAIGRGQLQVIEDRVRRKKEIFEAYKTALGDIEGIGFIPDPGYGRANYWLTCITLDAAKIAAKPEKIRVALEAENIESRPLWKPMHLQPVFKGCPVYTNGVSEKLFATGLCLPSGTGMTDEDLARVVVVLRKALTA